MYLSDKILQLHSPQLKGKHKKYRIFLIVCRAKLFSGAEFIDLSFNSLT